MNEFRRSVLNQQDVAALSGVPSRSVSELNSRPFLEIKKQTTT